MVFRLIADSFYEESARLYIGVVRRNREKSYHMRLSIMLPGVVPFTTLLAEETVGRGYIRLFPLANWFLSY